MAYPGFDLSGKVALVTRHRGSGGIGLGMADALAQAGGDSGRRVGQNEEPVAAVALLRRALDLNPDDVASLSNLGIAYKSLGLAEDARATFEMVLRRRTTCQRSSTSQVWKSSRSAGWRPSPRHRGLSRWRPRAPWPGWLSGSPTCLSAIGRGPSSSIGPSRRWTRRAHQCFSRASSREAGRRPEAAEHV
jgi:tetratricopeptide (TPR) repeat protein